MVSWLSGLITRLGDESNFPFVVRDGQASPHLHDSIPLEKASAKATSRSSFSCNPTKASGETIVTAPEICSISLLLSSSFYQLRQFSFSSFP
jgi:hypothetical protein